jgi:3-dehydroquinate dehydratase II
MAESAAGRWHQKNMMRRLTRKGRRCFLAILILVCTFCSYVFAQNGSAARARLRILVVNGPNMNLLGRRQPEIYGKTTLKDINDRMKTLAQELGVDVIFFQSNSEGAIVDTFQAHIDDVDGAIINPAGYSQHSIAIHDVIKAVPFPTVEVHISNIAARDSLHEADVVMPAVKGTVLGMGPEGYYMALRGLVNMLREEAGARHK